MNDERETLADYISREILEGDFRGQELDEADKFLASDWLAAHDATVRADAWDEGGLHELNQWAPHHASVPDRIKQSNPYRAASLPTETTGPDTETTKLDPLPWNRKPEGGPHAYPANYLGNLYFAPHEGYSKVITDYGITPSAETER